MGRRDDREQGRAYIDARKIKTAPGFYHINFFSLNNIKMILKRSGFKVLHLKKGNFFPIIPIKNKFIEAIDIKISRLVPPFLVNDWMFIAKKN